MDRFEELVERYTVVKVNRGEEFPLPKDTTFVAIFKVGSTHVVVQHHNLHGYAIARVEGTISGIHWYGPMLFEMLVGVMDAIKSATST